MIDAVLLIAALATTLVVGWFVGARSMAVYYWVESLIAEHTRDTFVDDAAEMAEEL